MIAMKHQIPILITMKYNVTTIAAPPLSSTVTTRIHFVSKNLLKNRPVRMFGGPQSTRHIHTVTTTAHGDSSSNTVAKRLTW